MLVYSVITLVVRVVARWFRSGELVGGETPWWRGDRNLLGQIIENCRPHAKVLVQVLVEQDEQFGLKFDMRWSCFQPFNCSTNFTCFFPEGDTLSALCVYQYYQLLRGPGVRILGLHCHHVGVQNKRKFVHIVWVKKKTFYCSCTPTWPP